LQFWSMSLLRRPYVEDFLGDQMSESKTVPITISMPSDTLNTLKLAANYYTLINGGAVTYGDIIREQCQRTSALFDIEKMSTAAVDPDFLLVYPQRRFWTSKQKAEFNETPTGKMISECIANHQWTPYLDLFGKLLGLWFKSKSIGLKMLVWDEAKSYKEFSLINRDPAAIAYTISYRGSIPTSIMESEEIVVPSVNVGGNVRIKYREQEPWFVCQVMSKSCTALQREAGDAPQGKPCGFHSV
jgi:hypothetical protein